MLQKKVQQSKLSDNDIQICLTIWQRWAATDNHKLSFSSMNYKIGLRDTKSLLLLKNKAEHGRIDSLTLDQAIASMPKKMRKAIKLKYLFGFVDSESAQVLCIHDNDFDHYIFQCRRYLARKLSL